MTFSFQLEGLPSRVESPFMHSHVSVQPVSAMRPTVAPLAADVHAQPAAVEEANKRECLHPLDLICCAGCLASMAAMGTVMVVMF